MLAGWYDGLIKAEGFTDVLMFGDCRAVHRPIHAIAEALGLRVFVFEEGYVRPHWLTLERQGVNGRSSLSRDPAWYLERRAETPPSPIAGSTGYSLYRRAAHDIIYRLANAVYSSRFPRYRSHRPSNGFVEYGGLAWRAIFQKKYEREANAVTRELIDSQAAYYLLPLQLNSDAQIIEHSKFSGIKDVILEVMQSFVSHAPDGALLVIKNHPLDTGLINYRKFSIGLASSLGIADRVRFIDAGHLPTLLESARGVVVVNSTVGLSALHHRRPLMALGDAIYSMAGLTWQASLDSFWREGQMPDVLLYHAFIDYVIEHTQINGDFYTDSGIAMAISGAIRRLDVVECGA